MRSNLIDDRVARRFEKRRLRNFTNHPYPSLERRGMARFQFIHIFFIDRAYSDTI